MGNLSSFLARMGEGGSKWITPLDDKHTFFPAPPPWGFKTKWQESFRKACFPWQSPGLPRPHGAVRESSCTEFMKVFFKFWSHCFCMLNKFQIPRWPVRTPNQEGLLWHESCVFPSSRLVSCSHPVHVFVARRCSTQGTCVGLSVGCDVSITGSFPPHPLLFHRELAVLVDSTWQIVLCTLAVIIRTLWWVDQEEKQSVWTAMTWVLTVPCLVSGRVDSGPAQWFQTIFAKKLCYPHLEAVLLSSVEWTMATLGLLSPQNITVLSASSPVFFK